MMESNLANFSSILRKSRNVAVGRSALSKSSFPSCPNSFPTNDAVWLTDTEAILKAGGAYVPLDPQTPGERLRHVLDDSGLNLLLTDRQTLAVLPALDGVQSLCLDTLLTLPNVKDLHTSFSLGEVKAGAALPLTHLGGPASTLARRRAIDGLRKKQAYARAEERLQQETEQQPDAWVHNSTEEEILDSDRRVLLRRVIGVLPPAQQQAIERCRWPSSRQ